MNFKGISQTVFSTVFFLSLLLFTSTSAFAVSVGILSSPATITQDAFTVTASVSGAQAGTNYLRVEFYREGTTNYFGETFNNTDWYGGSDGTQYFPITIQTNTVWNGSFQVRIGSPSITEYDGQGNYRMRLKRYTASGNAASGDGGTNDVSVMIAIPTNTPTPQPTATPNPTQSPSHTPTPVPTLKLTATLVPIKKPTQILPSEDVLATSDVSSSAEADISDESASPTALATKKTVMQPVNFSGIFFGIGGTLLIGCGILFIYKLHKSNEYNPNE